jgi:enoyl-CoA hydratase
MSEVTYEQITFELTRDNRVAWITLDNPDKMNALTSRLLDELDECLDRVEAMDTPKVLVFSGNQEAFSAGYDLRPSGMDSESAYEAFRREEVSYDRLKRIWDYPIPTIGAVDGYALAGGFELSQVLDIVVASTNAEFGYPIVRGTGTPPVFSLPFKVGNRLAREMVLTGRFVSGEEAAEVGLANRVIPPEDLEEAVATFIKQILKVPSDLLYLNKRLMNRSMDIQGFTSVLEHGHDLHITGHASPSVNEFFRRVREDSLKDALTWRDERTKA